MYLSTNHSIIHSFIIALNAVSVFCLLLHKNHNKMQTKERALFFENQLSKVSPFKNVISFLLLLPMLSLLLLSANDY